MSEHQHDHESTDVHEHQHTHSAAGKTLLLALVLTLGFSVVELFAGWRSGSLALLADAGHMVTDGASLAISALAAWLASLPPSRRHSYGLGKSELLAALINALSMLALVFGIGVEAWQRLQSPGSIDGATVGIVAIIGLLVSLLVAWILSRGEQNLNVAQRRATSHPIFSAATDVIFSDWLIRCRDNARFGLLGSEYVRIHKNGHVVCSDSRCRNRRLLSPVAGPETGKPMWLLMPAAVSLALFAWLLTLHPTAAGRTYAAYGGVYIAVALAWLYWVDGVVLTKWDIAGAAVALIGMSIIVLQPPYES